MVAAATPMHPPLPSSARASSSRIWSRFWTALSRSAMAWPLLLPCWDVTCLGVPSNRCSARPTHRPTIHRVAAPLDGWYENVIQFGSAGRGSRPHSDLAVMDGAEDEKVKR